MEARVPEEHATWRMDWCELSLLSIWKLFTELIFRFGVRKQRSALPTPWTANCSCWRWLTCSRVGWHLRSAFTLTALVWPFTPAVMLRSDFQQKTCLVMASQITSYWAEANRWLLHLYSPQQSFSFPFKMLQNCKDLNCSNHPAMKAHLPPRYESIL